MARVMQTTCCTAHTHLTRLRIMARVGPKLPISYPSENFPEGGLSPKEGGTLSSASTGGLAKI